MIKLFHEAPKAYFKEVQKLTDGDYALVHMFEKDPEYLQLFKDAVAEGREVILDNSLFELRETFDSEEFVKWIHELKPTYYIVPDAWKDCDRTIESFFNFINGVGKDLPGKVMGVAQGMDLSETVKCYQAIEPYCDRVAINFDYHVYYEEAAESYNLFKGSEYEHMAWGRARLLASMVSMGIINTKKEHHLLGCGVPQELAFYNEPWYDWITSIDTCSPVMMGIKGTLLGSKGVSFKYSDKMCDTLDYPYNEGIMRNIEHNINQMRKWSGYNG